MHLDEIKSGRDQSNIIRLLAEYVQCVKDNDYSFDRSSSAEVLGFLVDSILYLAGVLSNLKYVPITTSVLLLYYIFLLIFKIPQGRAYGMFY